MIVAPNSTLGSLGHLLDGGLRALDITPDEHARVVAHYTAFGTVLDDHWGGNQGDDVLFPQGSFTLGTLVRNIHRNDDIDIDAVALRDLDRASISQIDLKADVGVAARAYAASGNAGQPILCEDARCWTLSWPGMHFDILPALPNRELGGSSILITDRDVRTWQPSNPKGYANWFHGRMQSEFEDSRQVLTKRMQVDAVPDWLVRTVLQQVVQALKRHRDIYFADRLDDRPASIVITTLAALAYTGAGDLYEVLRNITSSMPAFLRQVDRQWVLANPVQPEENFVDSWAHHPERAEHFFEWIEAANQAFDAFGQVAGLDRISPQFKSVFGARFASAAMAALGTEMHQAHSDNRLFIGTGGALLATPPSLSARPIPTNRFAGGTEI